MCLCIVLIRILSQVFPERHKDAIRSKLMPVLDNAEVEELATPSVAALIMSVANAEFEDYAKEATQSGLDDLDVRFI